MKTRTDTRIHMAGADQFCADMLQQFPIDDSPDQSDRLLVVDFATRLYIPYHPSDIMMFGAVDDLIRYWSPKLCGPDLTCEVREDFGEMLQQATPEVVLCSSFLERSGLQLTYELDQWWEILASRFLVIDRDMIDLFWPKYNYNVDQRLGMLWDTGNMALCHFAQWMQIHSRSMHPTTTVDQLCQQRVFDAITHQSCEIAAA